MTISPHQGKVIHCPQPASAELVLQCRLGINEDSQPLLELLAKRFPYHPKCRWEELIRASQVRVNGQLGIPEQIVSTGDQLEYRAPDFSEPGVPTWFEPVMETPDLLLIGKPAGTPVSRTGLIVRNTLVNLLRRHYREEISPLHRLDRETSGLILCARNREACQRWQNPRPPLITGKYYLAIVQGRMPRGTRQSDQALAVRQESPVHCRMWPDPSGKPCRTIFHTLAANSATSLVLAELVSGRRHQIRAHLAHLGYPVVGDKIYSHDGHYYLKRISGDLTDTDFRELGAENHTLHAWAIRLRLTHDSESLFFSSIFSADMLRHLQSFPGWEDKALAKLALITAPQNFTTLLEPGVDHDQSFR